MGKTAHNRGKADLALGYEQANGNQHSKMGFFPQAGEKENLRGIEVTENIFKGIKHHERGEKKRGGRKVEKNETIKVAEKKRKRKGGPERTFMNRPAVEVLMCPLNP